MERWKSGGSTHVRNKSKAKEDEDFQEEEVWGNWGAMREGESSDIRPTKSHQSSSGKIPPSASRVNNHGYEASYPKTIPEWSKVHYKKPNTGFSEGVSWAAYNVDKNDDDGDDDEENDHEMVPPHEIVARRVARSAVVSSSMCEGVGRTLKGRDLSKLRNAILTKTGFLE